MWQNKSEERTEKHRGKAGLLRGLVASSLLLLLGSPAHAQSAEGEGHVLPADAREHISESLFRRAMLLFTQGDVGSARKLFAESAEVNPEGPRAQEALEMLRKCNEKLGETDLNTGVPELPETQEGPIDPYADPNTPIDPYAEDPAGEVEAKPTDPYAEPANPEKPPVAEEKSEDAKESEEKDEVSEKDWGAYYMAGNGAVFGHFLGMALAGPSETNEFGERSLKGSAVALGVIGAGAVGYLGYWAAPKLKFDEGQLRAMSSAGVWGGYYFSLLGNLFDGEDTSPNTVYRSGAVGALLGNGVGYLLAKNFEPEVDTVAVYNGLSWMGSAAGLFLGVAMDPPRGDAYSLNATLGGLGGLAAAALWKGEFDHSATRMHWASAGALAGAAIPWVLVYPFIDGEDNADSQGAGFLSALGIGVGGYLGWSWSKGGEEEEEEAGADSSPAVVQRSTKGNWGVGVPLLRPMSNPNLAPRQGTSLGLDLLSGRF